MHSCKHVHILGSIRIIITTGLAGGLEKPYKGLLPALSLKTRRNGSPAATSFTYGAPWALIFCFGLLAHPWTGLYTLSVSSGHTPNLLSTDFGCTPVSFSHFSQLYLRNILCTKSVYFRTYTSSSHVFQISPTYFSLLSIPWNLTHSYLVEFSQAYVHDLGIFLPL